MERRWRRAEVAFGGLGLARIGRWRSCSTMSQQSIGEREQRAKGVWVVFFWACFGRCVALVLALALTLACGCFRPRQNGPGFKGLRVFG